jgi:hypothetical protein
MTMQMGELAVRVDGKEVYSYKKSGGTKPTDKELLSYIGLPATVSS